MSGRPLLLAPLLMRVYPRAHPWCRQAVGNEDAAESGGNVAECGGIRRGRDSFEQRCAWNLGFRAPVAGLGAQSVVDTVRRGGGAIHARWNAAESGGIRRREGREGRAPQGPYTCSLQL